MTATRPANPLAARIRSRATRTGLAAWRRFMSRPVSRLFHYELIFRTADFTTIRWMGVPIWQNVLDLWTLQETISELRPALLVEIGTHRGGSALFYAQLMDLLGHGRVLTIDIEEPPEISHPRVTFLHGSSTDSETVDRVRVAAEEAGGPVMVILDGDHSRDHVAAELEAYAPMVTPGSYLLSQDGIIDELRVYRSGRPGPLLANRDFVARHPEFEHDRERNERFAVTHHPVGWLRRRDDGEGARGAALAS